MIKLVEFTRFFIKHDFPCVVDPVDCLDCLMALPPHLKPEPKKTGQFCRDFASLYFLRDPLENDDRERFMKSLGAKVIAHVEGWGNESGTSDLLELSAADRAAILVTECTEPPFSAASNIEKLFAGRACVPNLLKLGPFIRKWLGY